MKLPDGFSADPFAAFRGAAPVAMPGTFHVVNRILAKPGGFDVRKAQSRAFRKKLIHPKNAQALTDAMPREEGDRIHAIVGGDFIFGDLLCMICHAEPVKRMAVATLSMSIRNIDGLVECLDRNEIESLELLLSHYFVNSNEKERQRIKEAQARLGNDRMKLGAARTHTKVTLFEFPDRKLVIEASANLRSSDNVEQISAFCDAELFDFHAEWISSLMTKPLTHRSKV